MWYILCQNLFTICFPFNLICHTEVLYIHKRIVHLYGFFRLENTSKCQMLTMLFNFLECVLFKSYNTVFYDSVWLQRNSETFAILVIRHFVSQHSINYGKINQDIIYLNKWKDIKSGLFIHIPKFLESGISP